MNKFYTLILTGLISMASFAQTYTYSVSNGTEEPYRYKYSLANEFMLGAADEQMSFLQTMPFPWEFYGSTVQQYIASDNGYLTFDLSATTSVSANDHPPSAAGPNNAIYAFWDDMELRPAGGGPGSWQGKDAIRNYTYGVAPNRVHVVQWHSVTKKGGQNSEYLYFAIRMYECGGFDIVHNFSDVTGMSATIGCENFDGTDATIITSSATSVPGTTAASDDVVYTFYNGSVTYDIGIIDIDKTIKMANNTFITGTIRNFGSAAITQFKLNYQVDGGTTVVSNITGVNIAAFGGTYSFTHPTALNTTEGQVHTIKLWTSDPNNNPDEKSCGDTREYTVFVNKGITAAKYVLVEELTGAWCGECPDGAATMDELKTSFPTACLVSIHGGSDPDAMKITEGTAITNSFGAGYADAMFDRVYFDGETKLPVQDRDDWPLRTQQQLNSESPVSLNIVPSFNYTTRHLNVTVNASFVDYAEPGDIRINVYVVEDGVTGSGTGYDQVNDYNGESGHPYAGAGNPITGFVHNRVLRRVMSVNWGTPSIIPTNPGPGGNYSYSYTWTIPSAMNQGKMKVIAFLGYYDPSIYKRRVLNAAKVNVLTTGIDENEVFGDVSVYPNPANGLGYVQVNFAKSTKAAFEVYTLEGRLVDVIREGYFTQGNHVTYFDASNYSSGMYMIKITTDEGFITKKLSVVR